MRAEHLPDDLLSPGTFLGCTKGPKQPPDRSSTVARKSAYVGLCSKEYILVRVRTGTFPAWESQGGLCNFGTRHPRRQGDVRKSILGQHESCVRVTGM